MHWLQIPEENRMQYIQAVFKLKAELEQICGCHFKQNEDDNSFFFAESEDYCVFVDMVLNLNHLIGLLNNVYSPSTSFTKKLIVVCGLGQGIFYEHVFTPVLGKAGLLVIEKDSHKAINRIMNLLDTYEAKKHPNKIDS